MDNISFLKSNKLCPLTNWLQNGQVKENRKGFCLPSPTSYEARHIWRWKGKDQSRSPEREVSWTKTKLKLKSFRIRLVRHDSFRKKAFGSVCKLGRLLHLDVPKTPTSTRAGMSHGCSPGEERSSGQPAEQCTERTGSSLPFPSHPPWWTWDISPKSVQCGESNMGRGRNLHPNAAAGTEASLSLFFSGDKLNLEGEKKSCPWNIPPAGNFFRESPELWQVQVFF